MTPKNIHKIFIPQKIFIFLKNPKNIEIQNVEPQKNDPSLRMYENIRVPPPRDQPVYSRSLIGAFVIPFMKIIKPEFATRNNCIILGSLCSRVGWFVYDLVGNIAYCFSRVVVILEFFENYLNKIIRAGVE